ncbi:sensor histidine kinase, partial [Spirosoma sp.]|uniref:sensor histidine kinase n=1 Tax=Spirosoma sp. TaxID=1899569 RepID=UPI003B3A818E
IIHLNQQARLKEIALQKAQTTRNFIIAGAVMLIILLGLVYNRFQLKQTSHQQLVDRQKVIDHKNSTLQILLTEKEWLLKEIHHRVKNNLQIVMSLLNSQASYLSDKAALSAIQVSQHRVQAMALIHQNLYQSDNVNHIDMRQYIQEIVTYLRDFYDLPQPVTFSLAVQETHLTITEAIPVGLLINEAITNALKYAFPTERPGEIRVSFRSIESNKFELTIADNGIGLPLNPTTSHKPSLGMTLMHGFSMQLGGELTIKNDNGLLVHLLFSKELTDG